MVFTNFFVISNNILPLFRIENLPFGENITITKKGGLMKQAKNKAIPMLILAALFFSMIPVTGFAAFGSGVEVMASEVEMIKTGLLGRKLTFTDGDFKSAFAVSDFEKIEIKRLPSSKEGTLLLGGRRVSEGQQIKRKHLGGLIFVPASAEVAESSFDFILHGTGSELITTCHMKFIEKVNLAPEINEDKAVSLPLTTQEEIGIFGKLEATDPEGDQITYMIVAYPKKGKLELRNAKTGEYKYTPERNYTGYDKFTYVARDSYGNYTQATTVSIRVIDRMSSQVFADMKDRSEYNAAVAMSAMGIMNGSIVGDDSFFMPDESITKAEFVAMAMKTLGIRADSSLTETYFDDNGEIPKSLVGYVATAARLGIVNGSFDVDGLYFRPNDSITKCEAAIVMSNLLEVKADSAVFSEIDGITDVPVWARPSVGAMYSIGIFDKTDSLAMSESLTRESAAECLYRIALL